MGFSSRIQSIRIRLLQHGLLSMGLQVLPGPCSSTSSPQAATSFLPISICSGMESSSSMSFCSTTVLHRLHQGTQLPHQGLLQGLQGNLCSRVWSTSCPFFCIDVNVCGAAFLTCCFSPPSHNCYTMCFPFSQMHSPEVPPSCLGSSAVLRGGSVGALWNGLELLMPSTGQS